MLSVDFDLARLYWRTRCGSTGAWRVIASAHPAGASDRRYVLGPQVMAGDVYGMGRLPLHPHYSYQMIAGQLRHVIWRDYGEWQRDTAEPHEVRFTSLRIDAPLIEHRIVRSDDLGKAVVMPRSCAISATGRDRVPWLLEAPIQHINYRVRGGQTEFQVETGPILVPETLVEPGSAVCLGGFALAYLFLNRPDRADLALLQPVDANGGNRRAYASYTCLTSVEATLLA
jgi:hypothetical protein